MTSKVLHIILASTFVDIDATSTIEMLEQLKLKLQAKDGSSCFKLLSIALWL